MSEVVGELMRHDLHVVGDDLMPYYQDVRDQALRAAIIAVPTLITGYFGMNVPYPGFGEKAGFAASISTIALTGLVLYLIFKRKDWL